MTNDPLQKLRMQMIETLKSAVLIGFDFNGNPVHIKHRSEAMHTYALQQLLEDILITEYEMSKKVRVESEDEDE